MLVGAEISHSVSFRALPGVREALRIDAFYIGGGPTWLPISYGKKVLLGGIFRQNVIIHFARENGQAWRYYTYSTIVGPCVDYRFTPRSSILAGYEFGGHLHQNELGFTAHPFFRLQVRFLKF